MPGALAERIAERERIVSGFFEREADGLARACHAMARAFARGGTLIPFGTGPAATDAAHAAVEFMHPVIVGKRALPALAPSNDPTGLSTLARSAAPDDIALALSHGRDDPVAASFLDAARARGLLAIAICAGEESADSPFVASPLRGDHTFAVPSTDPAIVQEVQETVYHVLWELVHVFFEQPGLLNEACVTCGDVAVRARVVELRGATAVVEREGAREQVAVELIDGPRVGDEVLCHAGVALERLSAADGPPAPEPPDSSAAAEPPDSSAAAEPPDSSAAAEPTGFLYPFLGDPSLNGEHGPGLDTVLADVKASTLRKAAEVTGLRSAIDTAAVARCAEDLRDRIARGGRLIAFGNGGSATDAQDLAADALERGWRAIALGNDAATVTAVANDVGFEQVFARQLIALGRPDDLAVAISTSGGSPNLTAALEEARRRGMLTIGLAGHDGGRMAELGWLDHLFVVPSDHVPRIQEAQATIYHLLLEAAGSR